jgi:hypothetical protein
VHRAGSEGFRRRLIKLLFAGWIRASTVVRLGLPMSSDGHRLSSATDYLLGFPTVAFTAGAMHTMT